MVVDTHDYYTLSFRYIDIPGLIFSICSVYLFTVLNMKISKERQSVIAIACGLLMIAWIKHSFSWAIAALLICCTIPFPGLTGYIHKLWMGIAKVLGVISSHIILFILFYLILTPIALVKRLSTHKNSMTKFDKSKSSSFLIRNHKFEATDLLNPW